MVMIIYFAYGIYFFVSIIYYCDGMVMIIYFAYGILLFRVYYILL